MSYVDVLAVEVLDNPAKYTDDLRFKITFQCKQKTKEGGSPLPPLPPPSPPKSPLHLSRRTTRRLGEEGFPPAKGASLRKRCGSRAARCAKNDESLDDTARFAHMPQAGFALEHARSQASLRLWKGEGGELLPQKARGNVATAAVDECVGVIRVGHIACAADSFSAESTY